MGFKVTRIEPTPNPNAMKFILDRPVSSGSVSFLNAEQGEADPIARQLFAVAGVASVLFLCDFLTVNKTPDTGWPDLKKAVKRVLSQADVAG